MAWLHFSRTVRNLALSAASTWYLGVGVGLILSLCLWLWAYGVWVSSGIWVLVLVWYCLCGCDCEHVGVGFTLQGQWEVDKVGVARVVVNDCKISVRAHECSPDHLHLTVLPRLQFFFNDISVIKCKLGTWHFCPSPILYFTTLPSAFCTGQPSTWPSPSCKRLSLSRGYKCHYSFSNWWSSAA